MNVYRVFKRSLAVATDARESLRARLSAIPPQAPERPAASRPTAWRKFCSILALMLTLIGLYRIFSNWPGIWDISFSDEGIYLGNALNGAKNLMLDVEGSPLYCEFYRLVAFIIGSADATQIYLVGGLSVVLLGFFGAGLGVWAASRNLTLAVASIVLFVLLGAPSVWPRISFLSLFILGIGFAALAAATGRFNKIAILTLTCYVATFIRTEYALALYLSLAWALAIVVMSFTGRPLREGSASLTPGALAFVAVGGLTLFLPFPVLESGGRTFYAFAQHYSLRAVESGHTGLDPWLDWDEIMKADFPGVNSMIGAFLADPGLLLRNIAKNAFGILPPGWRSFMPSNGVPWGAFGVAAIGLALWVAWPHRGGKPLHHHRTICLTKAALILALLTPLAIASISALPKWLAVLTAMAAVLALIASALFPQARKLVSVSLSRLSEDNRGLAGEVVSMDTACAAVLLLAPTLSIVLLFPRDHYILLFAEAGLFLLAATLRRPGPASPIPAVAAAALFAILAQPIAARQHPNLAAVAAIRMAGPITHLMDADAGWCAYLIPRCKPAWAWDVPSEAVFPRYLDDDKIDAIVVSPIMLHTLAHTNPSFSTFLKSAGRNGWTRHTLPSLAPDAFLLVRTIR